MNVDPFKVEDYYFPVNLSQYQGLVGKVLTHVEAMNLPPAVEKANKDLVRQTLWGWWNGVQENSLTSYKGCIGPIYSPSRGYSTTEAESGEMDRSLHLWFTDIGQTAPTKDSDLKSAQKVI